MKLAAWLGWTQLDTKKITPAGVIEILEGFIENPGDGEDEGVDDEEPLTDEEAQEKRRAEVEAKLMAIFKHPDIKERQ